MAKKHKKSRSNIKLIQQTSLTVFLEIKDKLMPMQKKIYDLFLEKQYNQGLTNIQISKILNKPINTITPRVLELRKKGLIIKKDSVKIFNKSHMRFIKNSFFFKEGKNQDEKYFKFM